MKIQNINYQNYCNNKPDTTGFAGNPIKVKPRKLKFLRSIGNSLDEFRANAENGDVRFPIRKFYKKSVDLKNGLSINDCITSKKKIIAHPSDNPVAGETNAPKIEVLKGAKMTGNSNSKEFRLSGTLAESAKIETEIFSGYLFSEIEKGVTINCKEVKMVGYGSKQLKGKIYTESCPKYFQKMYPDNIIIKEKGWYEKRKNMITTSYDPYSWHTLKKKWAVFIGRSHPKKIKNNKV